MQEPTNNQAQEERISKLTERAVANGDILGPTDVSAPPKDVTIGAPPTEAERRGKATNWEKLLAARHKRKAVHAEGADTAEADSTPPDSTPAEGVEEPKPNPLEHRLYSRSIIIDDIKLALAAKLILPENRNKSSVYGCVNDFNALITKALDIVPPAISMDQSLRQPFGYQQMKAFRSNLGNGEGQRVDARFAINLLAESIEEVSIAKYGVRTDHVEEKVDEPAVVRR